MVSPCLSSPIFVAWSPAFTSARLPRAELGRGSDCGKRLLVADLRFAPSPVFWHTHYFPVVPYF